jgi:hypothetical protein
MSYFFEPDALQDAEELIEEFMREANYDDFITFTSGLSEQFKENMKIKIAQKIYNIHMEYYDDEG